MRPLGFKIVSCDYNYDVVRKAICSSYFINAAKIKSIGDYTNLRTGMPCKGNYWHGDVDEFIWSRFMQSGGTTYISIENVQLA